MKLTGIKIEGYRGFRRFQLKGLAQVNLLVGKNNSGKTSLLECTHILASKGRISALTDAAAHRGEILSPSWGDRFQQMPTIDVSHLFFGHEIVAGSRFLIEAATGEKIVVEATALDATAAPNALFEVGQPGAQAWLSLQLSYAGNGSREPMTLYISRDGALMPETRLGNARTLQETQDEAGPIAFISPTSLSVGAMSDMWGSIISNKSEANVYAAMRIIEPDLEDIVFQPAESYRAVNARAGIVAGLKGMKKRVPLGSMGDGTRRLLALAVSLISTQGGVLLIDEIDVGFHYSIMTQMWQLVLETARRLDIQVFATTHSADCVRGLASALKGNAELQALAVVHKIDSSLAQAVTFTGSQAIDAVENDIELR